MSNMQGLDILARSSPQAADITIVDVLRKRAREKPDDTSFVFLNGDGSCKALTFAHLWRRTQAVAANLQNRVPPGGRILLMYQPGLDFLEAILGCFAAGVVAVPVQPLQNRRVLAKLTGIVADAGCRLLLTNTSTKQALERLIPS